MRLVASHGRSERDLQACRRDELPERRVESPVIVVCSGIGGWWRKATERRSAKRAARRKLERAARPAVHATSSARPREEAELRDRAPDVVLHAGAIVDVA